MSRTTRRKAFHKELTEAMMISPTRRAKEERDTVKMMRDFLLETTNEEELVPPIVVMSELMEEEFPPKFSPHPFSDEYESGDATFLRSRRA